MWARPHGETRSAIDSRMTGGMRTRKPWIRRSDGMIDATRKPVARRRFRGDLPRYAFLRCWTPSGAIDRMPTERPVRIASYRRDSVADHR
jgi:hypothetical protein